METLANLLCYVLFFFFFLENSSCEVITGFFLRGLMGLEYVTKNWKGDGVFISLFSLFPFSSSINLVFFSSVLLLLFFSFQSPCRMHELGGVCMVLGDFGWFSSFSFLKESNCTVYYVYVSS